MTHTDKQNDSHYLLLLGGQYYHCHRRRGMLLLRHMEKLLSLMSATSLGNELALVVPVRARHHRATHEQLSLAHISCLSRTTPGGCYANPTHSTTALRPRTGFVM